MKCIDCMTSVRKNARFCDDCIDKDNKKKRINYTLMKCWFCSDSDSTKFKGDGMCYICKNHKAAIEYKDNRIGINPNSCYCCGKGESVAPYLFNCNYCNRVGCDICCDRDEKRNTYSCMSCHPPLSFTDEYIIMNSGKKVPITNIAIWFIEANNIKFENNNNKRKSSSPNNSNKKQKKSTTK